MPRKWKNKTKTKTPALSSVTLHLKAHFGSLNIMCIRLEIHQAPHFCLFHEYVFSKID